MQYSSVSFVDTRPVTLQGYSNKNIENRDELAAIKLHPIGVCKL